MKKNHRIQLLIYTLVIGICLWSGLEYLFRHPPVMKHLYTPSLETNYPPFDTNYHLLTVYEQEHGQVDCIFLGSSLVLNGINPQIVSDTYQELQGEELNCFNFGSGSLSAASMIQIAPILMEDFHPRLLVLGLALRDFDQLTHEVYLRQKTLFDHDWGRFRANQVNLKGFFLQNSVLFRYYQGMNQEVLLSAERFILGKNPSNGYVPNLYYRKSAGRYQTLFGPIKYWNPVDPDNQAALAALNDLAGNILVLEIPIPVSYQESSYWGVGIYAQLLTRLLTPLAVDDHLHLWRTTHLHPLFNAMDWTDFLHLYVTGSVKFSEWLGYALGETGIDHLAERPSVNLAQITSPFNETGLDLPAQDYYETVVAPTFTAPVFDPTTNYLPRSDHLFAVGSVASWNLAQGQPEEYTQNFELLRVLELSRREQELQLTPAQSEALTNWRNTKAAADLAAAGFEYLLVPSYWWEFLTEPERTTIQQDFELVNTWKPSSEIFTFSLYHIR